MMDTVEKKDSMQVMAAVSHIGHDGATRAPRRPTVMYSKWYVVQRVGASDSLGVCLSDTKQALLPSPDLRGVRDDDKSRDSSGCR